MSEIIPYTYDEIKNVVRNILIEKGYDAGVEGSNGAMLSDILGYVISSLNYNSAFSISETILSTASQRKNILQDARALGYEATNRISYQYRISLVPNKDTSLEDDDTTLRLYEIPKYTKFSSNGYTYYYVGDTISRQLSNRDITQDLENSIFSFNIKEGDLKLYEENSDLIFNVAATVDSKGIIVPLNYISIPYSNIEDNGLEIYVTYVNDVGEQIIDEPWEKANTFLVDKDSYTTKKYFRLRNIEFNTPDIYFNISGIGTILLVGSIIKANILISNGSNGYYNGSFNIDSLAIANMFTMYDGENKEYLIRNIVVGEDEESNESIKLNAPVFHNSANRAVVKGDYVSIAERELSVNLAQVWGGDEEYPVKLGHIWFSFIPSSILRTFLADSSKISFTLSNMYDSTYFITSEELKSSQIDVFGNIVNPGVFDVLNNYKIMTMQFHHRMPIYIDFSFNAHIIKYNINKSKMDINQSVFDVISNYFKNYLEKYDIEYFHSNLIKRIDTELTDITGFEMSLDLTIPIFSQHVCYDDEDINNGNVPIFLGYPYEQYFDEQGNFISGILPDISTQNFINGSLIVDWNSMIGNNTSEYIYFNIIYNNSICGKYTVSQNFRKYIRIDLYINNGSSSGVYGVSQLMLQDFSETQPNKIGLSYKTYNFKTYRNSIPRLLSVNFV